MLKRDPERSKKTKAFGARPRDIADNLTDIEVLRDEGVWRASPTTESEIKNKFKVRDWEQKNDNKFKPYKRSDDPLQLKLTNRFTL